MPKWITAVIIMVALALPASPGRTQEAADVMVLPNPDWVHPSMRQQYPGYEKHNQDRASGTSWTFSTNRPGGAIRGGGTTPYSDYRPLYPTQQGQGKQGNVDGSQ